MWLAVHSGQLADSLERFAGRGTLAGGFGLAAPFLASVVVGFPGPSVVVQQRAMLIRAHAVVPLEPESPPEFAATRYEFEIALALLGFAAILAVVLLGQESQFLTSVAELEPSLTLESFAEVGFPVAIAAG